jgi:hypothetical protein
MPARTQVEPKLDALLTPEELAPILRTSVRNLREWRVCGTGPKFVRVGRFPLYRPSAVDDWLRHQEFASTSAELR